MQDLNDMLFFAEVVDRGGFAAAGRALNLPKSRLSRRVAELEDRLGVRLLQRTTRKLSLTEAGEIYHRHCATVRRVSSRETDWVPSGLESMCSSFKVFSWVAAVQPLEESLPLNQSLDKSSESR